MEHEAKNKNTKFQKPKYNSKKFKRITLTELFKNYQYAYKPQELIVGRCGKEL